MSQHFTAEDELLSDVVACQLVIKQILDVIDVIDVLHPLHQKHPKHLALITAPAAPRFGHILLDAA